MSGHLGHILDCEYSMIYHSVIDPQSVHALLLYLNSSPQSPQTNLEGFSRFLQYFHGCDILSTDLHATQSMPSQQGQSRPPLNWHTVQYQSRKDKSSLGSVHWRTSPSSSPRPGIGL